ncbi:MAG: DNA polymerase III subunit chi [Deltaproteobacteria bacterium]|nr:DNA polymerase III subunit chi [Deltaproteobacteria bacterium]
MARVAFIKLEKAEKARYCCLLAEKHFQEGARVLIVVEHQEQATQLDKYLWTWRKTSFVPHRLATGPGDGGAEPVVIAAGCEADFGAAILIMVRPCPVEFLRRFTVVYDFAELYDAQLQEESRRRYVLYRDAGLEPFMYQ